MPPNEHTETQDIREKILANNAHRQALLKHFAPTFYFHKNEENFPVDPNKTIKEIITAKKEEYEAIKDENNGGKLKRKGGLTQTEKEELDLIDLFFWDTVTNTFDDNYKRHQNNEKFRKATDKGSSLLIFDERHYGYAVGEKIDVVGDAPVGSSVFSDKAAVYREENRDGPVAPITASIFKTKDGFFIQYEYLYALNNAIYGTRWLQKLLPEWICKKLGNFGFHYGDAEKVGIHVTVDDAGNASFKAMQTWAHGRDYAQLVEAEDCTFDASNHVCVYVGLGGHPSYAHKFVSRNLPMDLVGDACKMESHKGTIMDLSRDVVVVAALLQLEKRDGESINECIARVQQDDRAKREQYKGTSDFDKNTVFTENDETDLAARCERNYAVLTEINTRTGLYPAVRRFADSNPLAHNGVNSEKHLLAHLKHHNKYSGPSLFLARIKAYILSFFYPSSSQQEPTQTVKSLSLSELVAPNGNLENREADTLAPRQKPPQPQGPRPSSPPPPPPLQARRACRSTLFIDPAPIKPEDDAHDVRPTP